MSVKAANTLPAQANFSQNCTSILNYFFNENNPFIPLDEFSAFQNVTNSERDDLKMLLIRNEMI